MKKIVALLFVLTSFSVLADTWKDPKTGITWTYMVKNGEASIGDEWHRSSAIPTSTTGAITIPSALGGYQVTSIGYAAFSGCRGLTSVTIPEGVTSIGAYAFHNCIGLTSVTIPLSVTSLDDGAFEDCVGLTSVTIPSSVTNIGSSAFCGCSGLTSMTIPSSVTSIYYKAFYNCSGLESVTIPSSVTSIDSSVFFGCSGLICFYVDENNLAYSSRNGILCSKDGTKLIAGVNGNVIIPDGVMSIGEGAFSSRSKLESVTIPSSVTSIDSSVFFGCSGLICFYVDENNLAYSSRNGILYSKDGTKLIAGVNGNVIIPDCVTSIGEGAFSSRSKLESVTIPSSVTSIGEGAFDGCSGLTSVTIPACITGLYNTFPSAYTKIKEVVICDGVTSIGDYAFYGCSGLISVTIPSSVTSIGGGAFYGCSGLTSVTIPSCVISIGDCAFEDCSGLISVTIPESVTSIGDGAFNGCSGLESVTIPSSVRSIGDSAFSGCSGLTSITIPESVASIGWGAFYGCSGLMAFYVNENNSSFSTRNGFLCSKDGTKLIAGVNGEVVVPGCVTSIGDYAFYGCSGLTLVMISEGVTSIGAYAFCDCNKLTEITIPSSITSIGGRAFNGCSELTKVNITDLGAWCDIKFGDNPLSYAHHLYFNGEEVKDLMLPKSVTSIGDNAFYGCSGLTSVTIPSNITKIGSRAFGGCSSLASATMMEGVTSIGNYAFENCSGLTSVTIPSSVTSIGFAAFDGCSGLTSVMISDGVTSVGVEAFRGCCGLTSVTIPEGVISIGWGAFYGCSGLESVTIPSSVRSIGICAFQGCSGLTAVTIPEGVTSIGGHAFRNCSGLKSVTIPSTMTCIEDYVFNGCDRLESIIIPPSVTSIGLHAFDGTLVCDSQPDGMVILGGVLYKYKGNCPSLVTIPSNVTSIGDEAFRNCSGLTQVTIPSNITMIGSGAFRGCSNIEKVVVDSLSSFGKISFESMDANPMNVGNPTLYVGDDKVEGTCRVTFDILCGEEEYGYPYGAMYSLEDGTIDYYNQTQTIEVEIGKGVWGPEVVSYDWNHVFDKWDNHHFGVTSDTTINAVWRRKTIDEACDEWQRWPYGTIEYSLDDNGHYYLQGKIDSWSLEPFQYSQAELEIDVVCYDYAEELYRKKCLLSDVMSEDGTFTFIGNFNSSDIVGGISIVLRSSEFDGERYILFISAEEFESISAEHYQLSLNDIDGEMEVHSVKAGNFVDVSYQDYNLRDASLEVFADRFKIKSGTNIKVYVPLTEADNITEVRTIKLSNGSYTSIAYVDPAGYRVHFDLGTNGVRVGGGEVEQVVLCDELAEAPIVEGKRGWRFVGWDGDFDITAPVTQETTYHAVYELIDYPISYTNLREQDNSNPSTYTILDEITFSPLADAEGWIFKRWNPSKISVGTIGAMEVEAQWQRVTNTVNYVVGEYGRIKSGDEEQLIEYDEVSAPPEVDAVPGWRFIGWNGDTSIGVTAATTFTAQYEPIEYTITYANDRGMDNPNPSTYTILDAITFLPLAEKSGLRFVGWDKPSIALGSIGDITVTASWEECELQDIVDVPKDSISFGGDADWLLVYVDGKWTMRSGKIAKSQSSYCDIKFTGPAKVSFSLKVSCEAQSGEDMTDGMELLVDGESVLYISGITNWEDKYIDVLGEGEHTVRWCYSKDNKTDEGDDCCYLSDLVVTPIYNIAFTDGGADGGESPTALNVWKDGEYELPDCGTLYKTKYAFVGWKLDEVIYPAGAMLTATESVEFTAVWEAKVLPTPIVEVAEYYTTETTTVTIDYGVDGVTGCYKLDGGEPMVYEGPFEIEGAHTIIAYAIHEDYFDSAVTEEYASVRAPWTIGECLNYDGTFGDTTWVRDLEVTHDGKAAMRSGITANKESSQLTMTINGSARVSFWVKTSSEYDDYDGEVYDGFVCYIDGVAQNEKLIGGEIDWQELSFDVVGAGEHILTLSYEKDKSGSGGEDCVWVDEVKIASVYDILFKCEDMDMGEPPQSLARQSGEKFELPDCGTLKKPKYAFAGWKLGGVVYLPGTMFTVTEPMEFTAVWEAKLLPTPIVEVAEYYTTEKTTVTIDCGVDGVIGYYRIDGGEPIVYDGPFEIEGTHTLIAYAIHDDYFDSAVTKEYTSIRAPWTIGECVNYDGTFGDTTWVRDLEVTHDGKAAMRSGITGNKESSQLTLSVSGNGMLAFWCKTSSEYDIDDGTVYDGMVVYIDGVAQNSDLIGGDTDWTRYDFEVVGEGEHTIVWSYEKDKGGADGEDCAWIDEVKWERKMAGGAVIGDMTELKEVFGSESSVVQNLTSEEELTKFNEFLGECGITAANQISEKQKQYAYESFKLSAITVEQQLFEDEPKLKIDDIELSGGNLSLTISLTAGAEEIALAKDALKQKIRVGVSLDAVEEPLKDEDIISVPSEDGTSLTFTVKPPSGKQGFVKVKID